MTATLADLKAARDKVVHAAVLSINNKDAIHYTQDWQLRWEGINNHLIAANGQFPHHADCSAFATWCLWQVLRDGPDVINGQDWKAGYTGTMVNHGEVIHDPANARAGDCVLYGNPTYHTAILIGRRNGVLVAASHGEESGPYVVPWNTWGVNSIRRYLSLDTLSAVLKKPSSTQQTASQPAAPSGTKLLQGTPVPRMIREGTGQFFGVRGSRGLWGATDVQRDAIKKLQQRLIVCGFVTGVNNPRSNWVDGVFESPTRTAVVAFQRRHMPNTQFPGQVWYDDWHKLFNL